MGRKIKLTVGLFFVLGALVYLPVSTAAADDGIETLRQTSKAFADVAQKVTPAVVSVRVEKAVGNESGFDNGTPFGDEFFERFFGPRPRQRTPEKQMRTAQGSGFIISPDGLILTNNHVVKDSDNIKVKLHDGREFKATVVGTDEKSDVALIKIKETNLPVVELGDSDQTRAGEWVIAIGNPFGLEATVTVGVISAKGRVVGITEGGYEDFIQTDAAINFGNSGGPLLNLDGRAIGMNTAIFSQSGGYIGIGFAIPINIAKAIKEQLLTTGKVKWGYLGIVMNPQGVTQELAESFGLKEKKGVLVSDVETDSPADKAGLKPGDIILKLNGQEVVSNETFRNSIAFLAPDTEIKLAVFRNGKEVNLKAQVGSLAESAMAANVTETGEKLGLQVQELTGELAKRFGYTAGHGVIVSDVRSGSPADQAGIKAGMLVLNVNHHDVNSVKEFNSSLEESAKTKKALIWIRSGRYAQYVVLTLE